MWILNKVVFYFWIFTLLVVAIVTPLSAIAQQDITFNQTKIVIETKSGNKHGFAVELAESNAQKSRGLMFRTQMAADAGMLFLYKQNRVVSMWMANTFLPLDILFVEANGRIASIAANTIPQSREPISSRKRVLAVLELNAGAVSRLGISVGDRVIHERFK